MRWSVVLVTGALVVACSGGAGGGDAGVQDGGAADAGVSDAGHAYEGPLWPVGATEVVGHRFPGMFFVTCGFDGGSVTGSHWRLVLPSGEFSWQGCEGSPTSGASMWVGSRVLDAGELDRFDVAMRQLVHNDAGACSAEGESYLLEVTTPEGVIRYVDLLCEPRRDTVLIKDLHGVIAVLNQLAR